MAYIKIVLYTHKKLKNGKHPIMMRIIHNRKDKYFSLGHSADTNEWDIESQRATKKHELYKSLNHFLDKKQLDANEALLRLEYEKPNFSIDDILNTISNKSYNHSFIKYSEKIIKELETANKHSNASVYKQSLNFLKRYTGKEDITFGEIDFGLLKSIEAKFMSKKSNSYNGLSFYLRTVRAIFNRAIKEGVVKKDNYPFENYSIKNEKTQKRAISKDDIEKIKSLQLPVNTSIWHAKNIFMFSFYAIGINFSDIARLKRKSIVDDRINYIRSKTGKEYSIKITDKIKDILNLYSIETKKNEDYIFPIIKNQDNERLEMSNTFRLFNKKLKKIATLCDIDANLTSYVARHSWATIAYKLNMPIGVISEGLGHEDIKTTQIYIDSLDKSAIDKANEMITDI